MNLGLLKASIDVGESRLQNAVAKALGHAVSGGHSAATEEISRQLMSTRGTSPDQIEDTLRAMNVQLGELTKKVRYAGQASPTGSTAVSSEQIESLRKSNQQLKTELSQLKKEGATPQQRETIGELEEELSQKTTEIERINSEHNALTTKLNESIREAKAATETAKKEGTRKLKETQKALEKFKNETTVQSKNELNKATSKLATVQSHLELCTKKVEDLEAQLKKSTTNMSEEEMDAFRRKKEEEDELRTGEIEVIIANRVNTHPPLRDLELDDEIIKDDIEENKFYGDLKPHEQNNIKLDEERPTRLVKVSRNAVSRFVLADKMVVWNVDRAELLRRKQDAENAKRPIVVTGREPDPDSEDEYESEYESDAEDESESESEDEVEDDKVNPEVEDDKVNPEVEDDKVNPEVMQKLKDYFTLHNNSKVDPTRGQLFSTYSKNIYGGSSLGKMMPTGVRKNKLPGADVFTKMVENFTSDLGQIVLKDDGVRKIYSISNSSVRKTLDSFNAWASVEPKWGKLSTNETFYAILYIIHMQGLEDNDGKILIQGRQNLVGNPKAAYESTPFSSMFMWM